MLLSVVLARYLSEYGYKCLLDQAPCTKLADS